MKCLLLAAGYATRLYPLTENFPKPLLKLGEKSILDWLVDDVARSGLIDEFVVISNHKFAGQFEAWAKAHTLPITVVDDGTSSNDTRLGAVRDIQFAIDKLNLDDDLLILAGDFLLDCSLRKFLDYIQEKKSSCVMRYWEGDVEVLRKAAAGVIDADERLLFMEEKPLEPKSHWCMLPFYFYKREDAARIREAIEDGCGTDAPGSLAAWMCEHTTVYCMDMPSERFDIGDIPSYDAAQKAFRGIREA